MERRKRHKRKSRKQIYGIIAVALVFFYILTYSFLHPTNQTNINQRFSYKATIVDHLSLSEPNQSFIQTATTILENAGFTVDYYSNEEITVEFYRKLPTRGYGLILLRVHSAVAVGTTRLVFFTSERYSEMKYVYEQLTGQIGIVAFLPYHEEDPLYFGIDYKFVKTSMNGRFENTIIIMMGCNGLTYTAMAEAFVEKGARVYISWSGSVLASHTDQATTRLLQHIVTEKQTIKKAIVETMKEVGPDPVNKSVLTYYPIEAGSYIIPESSSNMIINVAEINVQYFKRDKNVVRFFSSQFMRMNCCE